MSNTPHDINDSAAEIAARKELQGRIDNLTRFFSTLDGTPSTRVSNLLGGATTLSVDTIKQLMELDVWPTLHKLIDNESYTSIESITLPTTGKLGVIILSQVVGMHIRRKITFTREEIISDQARLIEPPGKLIAGPREKAGGIDDLDDKMRGIKPL